jgi:hypothetical protein
MNWKVNKVGKIDYSETRLRKTQLRKFPAKEVRIKKHQNSPISLKIPF